MRANLSGSWAAACFLAVGLAGAQHPDLSGSWTMNPARSDYGPLPVPEKLTQRIEHADPALRIVSTQSGRGGQVTSEVKYSTDGRESVHRIMGNEARSTAKWSGGTLLIDTRFTAQGADVLLSDKWNLSADGRSLTVLRHIRSPQGDMDIRFVLEKQ